ncbi:MAG TPA: hypothetical protein VFG29_00205 [Syntrophales bacterium]|nr:hypothetical protein [Syntrophales bacterium]
MHPTRRLQLIIITALLSMALTGYVFFGGTAQAATSPVSDLKPQQGRYFKWASPAGWRHRESNAGVTLTSPDGRYSAFLAMVVRSSGSRTPLDFLQWMLNKTGCTNVKIISTKQLPAQRMSYQVWQFIEVNLSYSENGQPMMGMIKSGVANYYGMNDAMIVGYRTSPGDFKDARSFMSKIAKSIILTNAAQASGNDTIIRPKNNPLDNSEMIRSWEKNQRTRDEAMRKDANARRGTVDLYDPSTGETIQAWKQQKSYYWRQPGSNTVVGTDTSTPPGVGYVPLTPH